MNRLPELLAPAGDWDCVKAAVENGADGVYFGLDRFNARLRASNFGVSDLAELMPFLHRRGVRGYVAFNTLVFADELEEAERTLRTIIQAGADGVMVQDVGICRLIRRLSPDFPIHASTQMTVTSAAGVEFARQLGCSRVVLARECSIDDLKRIRLAQESAALQPGLGPPVELEVFVHGALCVAYSGQCLTSESLGGRSANRGECAQACRMPYELVVDGKALDLGDRRYLLSPRDLAGLELLPELVRLGVSAVKIEGRLKSPLYVANITRVYRQTLDQIGRSTGGAMTVDAEARRYEMEMAFSRGLHTGWLHGTNHQQLVHGRFGKKRGVYLGQVCRVKGERVWVRLEGPLKPGDGVAFDAGKPDQDEEGGRVYSVTPEGTETVLAFGRGDVGFGRIHSGDRLWKTSDQELDNRLRRTFEGSQPRFLRPVCLEIDGSIGQPLRLIARDEQEHEVQARSAMPLVAAVSQPLTTERLSEQLGRLGGTPFRLDRLTNRIEDAVMLPLKELNRLRREAIGQLENLRGRGPNWTLEPEGAGTCRDSIEAPTTKPSAPRLNVLVRSLEQLEAALQPGVTTLYCDFENPRQYRQAVASFQGWKTRPGNREACLDLFVAPPRVTKSDEEWTLRQVRSCDADGYLVRNHDQLRFFSGARCVGDYTLNIANQLAAEYFMRQFGLERVTASYDLNHAQLEALLRVAPPTWFEITIHQHMPMFHMEHCLFAAFISGGTDFKNCGRPCDCREVRLRDRRNAEHAVKADAGCRNTVFNALAQTGAEYAARLIELGARFFRIEFLDDTPEQVARTIGMYASLLQGEVTGRQLWLDLKLKHQLGVTRGSLDHEERPVCAI